MVSSGAPLVSPSARPSAVVAARAPIRSGALATESDDSHRTRARAYPFGSTATRASAWLWWSFWRTIRPLLNVATHACLPRDTSIPVERPLIRRSSSHTTRCPASTRLESDRLPGGEPLSPPSTRTLDATIDTTGIQRLGLGDVPFDRRVPSSAIFEIIASPSNSSPLVTMCARMSSIDARHRSTFPRDIVYAAREEAGEGRCEPPAGTQRITARVAVRTLEHAPRELGQVGGRGLLGHGRSSIPDGCFPSRRAGLGLPRPPLGTARSGRPCAGPAVNHRFRSGPMRPNGLEPSRGNLPTRPSTLRVYQFRHGRRGGEYSPGWRGRSGPVGSGLHPSRGGATVRTHVRFGTANRPGSPHTWI